MQLIDDGDSAVSIHDYLTSKQLAEVLTSAYPGYQWAVRVQWDQGVADIMCMDLPPNYAYRIKLIGGAAFSASSFELAAKTGAGEILERFNLSRSHFKADEYETAPVDFRGLPVGDVK